MRFLRATLALMVVASPLAFAQRDFLTTNEVEQVRDTQEPNLRMKLYVLFARQRMDQFNQLMKKDKKGRSLEARQLLEDYSGLIDAMTDVSDDALKRHVSIVEGLAAVTDAERKFLTQLQALEDHPPADIGLYDTAFREAIAATEDALELAHTDAAERTTELLQKDREERKESKSVLAAEDHKGPITDADLAAPDSKPKRKPPTLMRPGEKAPGTTH